MSVTTETSTAPSLNGAPKPAAEAAPAITIPETHNLNPADYRWHVHPTDPSITQRNAVGVETLVGIKAANSMGAYDFFNSIVLRVFDIEKLTLASFKKALIKALLDARFENPVISCYGSWGQNESPHIPHIQYKSFKDDAEALAWANEIVQIHATTLSCEDFRAERNSKHRAAGSPKPKNPLDVYVCADVASEDALLAPGAKIDFMCLYNHLSWDGNGRLFSSELVQRAVKILDEKKENVPSTHAWGEEKERLDPGILDVLSTPLDQLGQKFENTRKLLLGQQLQVGTSWGMPVAKKQGLPCEARHNLTADHTKKLMEAVKSRLGPKYNIGHLGHAAQILALLKHAPIPDDATDSTHLYSPLPVNGRRYLKEDRKTMRYGNCQSSCVVEFKRLADWAIDESDPDGVKKALEKLAKHIKESYDFWLATGDYQVAMTASNHQFTSAFVAAMNIDMTPPIYTPPFCNDGRAEALIGYEIKGSQGQKLFDVDDCFGGMDVTQHNAIFRMDSWKGVVRFQYDYNDGFCSHAQAQSFMADTVNYMVDFIR